MNHVGPRKKQFRDDTIIEYSRRYVVPDTFCILSAAFHAFILCDFCTALKVLQTWWHHATYFDNTVYYTHSFASFIQHIHSSPFADVLVHLLIANKLREKNLPAEPKIELRPVLLQDDALPTELRHRTLESYAALC
jgi:hypothetical protein